MIALATPPRPVRLALLFGIPALALVAIMASMFVLQSELPAEVPSHWSGSGLSDDTMPLNVFTGLFFVLAGLSSVGLHSIRHKVGPGSMQRMLAGMAVGMPVFFATIHIGSLLAARGTSGPIAFPGSAMALAVFLLLALSSVVAMLIEPIERAGRALVAEQLAVEPGEAVIWTGSVKPPTSLVAFLGLAAVVAGVVAMNEQPWMGVVLLVVLGSVFLMLRARVAVGPSGLSVRIGLFGLLTYRIGLADITTVRVEMVEPLAYGGWGLRVLPGVRAVVLRQGPGLVVEQREGPTLVVTIDEAPRAAGVLLAHAAEAGIVLEA